MTKNDFLHKIIEMLKTINIGNRIEKDKEREEIWTHREKVSPAESTFERRNCEVPPGVDPVNGVAGYVRHTLRA